MRLCPDRDPGGGVRRGGKPSQAHCRPAWGAGYGRISTTCSRSRNRSASPLPTSAHFASRKPVWKPGKHVLVEKPIAVTVGRSPGIGQTGARNAAASCRSVTASGSIPIMQLMRPHIDRPAFIECHRLSSFGERGTDVDVVLGSDDSRSGSGALVQSGAGRGGSGGRGACALVQYRYRQCAHCVCERMRREFDASRVSTNKMRRLRVFQRDRYVSIDFQTRQAVVSRRVQDSGSRPAIDVEILPGRTMMSRCDSSWTLSFTPYDGSRPVVRW